jgi:hypothetical protein
MTDRLRLTQWQEPKTLSASAVCRTHESPVLILVLTARKPAVANWLRDTTSLREEISIKEVPHDHC